MDRASCAVGRHRCMATLLVGLGASVLGCGRVAYDPTSAPDGGAGPDASTITMDATAAPDAQDGDAAASDAGVDAGIDAPDASPPDPWSCDAPLDEDTVARYRFEDVAAGLEDDRGLHGGMWQGGRPPTIPGPPGCGSAFQGTEGIWGRIEDAPEMRLASGSIDVWIRLPSDRPLHEWAHAVFSKDIRGVDPLGQLSLFWERDGRLVVRIQSALTNANSCSDAVVPTDRWMHVGINFGVGGLELFIDGVRQGGTGTWRFRDAEAEDCGTEDSDQGLEMNDLPWVLGANSFASPTEVPIEIQNYFPGAIDQLRVSRARRDFATFSP